MGWSRPKGFNFRTTQAFVTDLPDETFVGSTVYYPTVAVLRGERVVYGWDTSDYGTPMWGDRDRVAIAPYVPELSGINYGPSQFYSGGVAFRVDLPQVGRYRVRIALGDAQYSSDSWAAIEDGRAIVVRPIAYQTTNAGSFIDAIGVQRTGQVWRSANVGFEHNFRTTRCGIRIYHPGANTNNFSYISHVQIEPLPPIGGVGLTAYAARRFYLLPPSGGGGNITVALTGQSIATSAGSLGPQTAASLTGAAIATSAGLLSPSVQIALAGLSLTFTPGTLTATVGGNVTVALTGAGMTLSAGGLAPASAPALTGAAATLSAGQFLSTLTAALVGAPLSIAAGSLGVTSVAPLAGIGAAVSGGFVAVTTSAALAGLSLRLTAGRLGAPVPTLIGDPRYTIARVTVRNFTARRAQLRNFTVNSMSIRFPVKGPAESVPVTFNFLPDLPTGVTLTGAPTVTIAATEGTDPNPSAIQNGAAGFNAGNTAVVLPTTGGLDGCEYTITCSCSTTQSNLTLTLVGILPVRANLN